MKLAHICEHDFYPITGVSLQDLRSSIEDWILSSPERDTTDFFRSRDRINQQLDFHF
jgi:hypothetical protein